MITITIFTTAEIYIQHKSNQQRKAKQHNQNSFIPDFDFANDLMDDIDFDLATEEVIALTQKSEMEYEISKSSDINSNKHFIDSDHDYHMQAKQSLHVPVKSNPFKRTATPPCLDLCSDFIDDGDFELNAEEVIKLTQECEKQ